MKYVRDKKLNIKAHGNNKAVILVEDNYIMVMDIDANFRTFPKNTPLKTIMVLLV